MLIKISKIFEISLFRSDLKELRDLDLGGAPYGYTPFCDSNADMEGFRFWKSGYWKNHLAGKPYHISALYVVDLVRFRQIAAGDRLRGQYQALSQDPNSLANLDQDLPNNMIHQVCTVKLAFNVHSVQKNKYQIQIIIFLQKSIRLETNPFLKYLTMHKNVRKKIITLLDFKFL